MVRPWPPVMLDVAVDDLPAGLRRLAEAALAVGWAVWSTFSAVGLDGEAVETLAVRLSHGEYRCYGVWRLGTSPTGRESVKWLGGACRQRALPTLDAFKTYAGLA